MKELIKLLAILALGIGFTSCKDLPSSLKNPDGPSKRHPHVNPPVNNTPNTPTTGQGNHLNGKPSGSGSSGSH